MKFWKHLWYGMALILPISFGYLFLQTGNTTTVSIANQGKVPSGFQCYTPKRSISSISGFRGYENPGDTSLPNINKKFIVVLHITQDSLGNKPLDDAGIAQAKNDIIAGGGYFSRIGISFEPSDTVFEIDNHRFDVIETEEELNELSRIYAKENRINLFIINRYAGELEGGCGIAGDFSMYMAAGCLNPTSFGHETGHIFGLPHTFGGGAVFGDFVASDELADGSNCVSGGDAICDTPADPYIPNDTTGIVWVEDCAFIYDGLDANGDYYDPDLGNIMSYYFESCACGVFFTKGQLQVMADTYENSTSKYLWW